MSKSLLVQYDPFTMESRVAIFNEHVRDYARVCSTLEELTEEVITMAYENDIYDIKVCGPFGIASQLNKMVQQYELNKYSQNKISVEGL